MYDEITEALRLAYDNSAVERDKQSRRGWKERERQAFLKLLHEEKKRCLLEIGAGPGTDSKFFQDNGLQVLATDLSPMMIKLCLAKGLSAELMDFKQLTYSTEQFDAAYALNCLLHVPKTQIHATLVGIKRVLKPSGLFYLAVYGGQDSEGIWEEDHHRPKRFFSFFTDAQLLKQTDVLFKIEDFKVVRPEGVGGELHVQRLILRKKKPSLHNK